MRGLDVLPQVEDQTDDDVPYKKIDLRRTVLVVLAIPLSLEI